MKSSLFQEHWQRFNCVPQQSEIISDAVSEAIFWNDQMGWSLGIIPWVAWRYPFQKNVLQYLCEHCPEQKEPLYDHINTALATTHGDYFSLPSEKDRDSLIATVKTLCSEQVAATIIQQLSGVKPHPPFLHSLLLEKLLQLFSQKRKLKREGEFVCYLSYFLHFRIVDTFLTRWLEIAKRKELTEFNDVIALMSFDILWHIPLQAPHFFTEKRVKADPEQMSPEIYNFWTWQYTYRNENYQNIRKPLDKFVFSSGVTFGNISISNHKEYLSVYKRHIGETNVFGMIFPEFDNAIDNSIEQFNYYPTWPIKDYTSDFILGRMLSGDFKYWERETPPPKVSREKEFNLCLRNPALCTNDERITQMATDGKNHFKICAPECIMAMKKQEQTLYHEVISEERSRVRSEAIHRMIGLWLWDYCTENNTKVAEAIEALKERHFPLSNPAWDITKIPEIKDTPQNRDWYDFREKVTTSTTLYADYQDAEYCIKAAKFLPRQRGLKKDEKLKQIKTKKK